MPRTTWFCVDIECNGPVPGLYAMVSLGVVPVFERDGDFVIGEGLYLEFKPEAPRHDARAASIHGLDQDRLQREGLPLAEGLTKLAAWVGETRDPESAVVFVGHNAPFDWSFVNHGYHAHGIDNPFGYKALDTKALAAGVLNVHWLEANKELLAELLTLPEVETGKVHRADYDAWYQAHILVELLRRQRG